MVITSRAISLVGWPKAKRGTCVRAERKLKTSLSGKGNAEERTAELDKVPFMVHTAFISYVALGKSLSLCALQGHLR